MSAATRMPIPPTPDDILSGRVTALVVYDLEYTAWEGSAARAWSGPNEFPEVVQIGAVKISGPQRRETAAFTCLVRPRFHPELSDYFVTLTGISQADVDIEGIEFPEAFRRFIDFAAGLPLVAFGNDWEVLARNCARHRIPPSAGGARPIDLRGELCRRLGLDPRRVTSGELPGLLGLAKSGRAHDALADARSVASALRTLPTPG